MNDYLKSAVKEAIKELDEEERKEERKNVLRDVGLSLVVFAYKGIFIYLPILVFIFSFTARSINYQGVNWLLIIHALMQYFWLVIKLVMIAIFAAMYAGFGFLIGWILIKSIMRVYKIWLKRA